MPALRYQVSHSADALGKLAKLRPDDAFAVAYLLVGLAFVNDPGTVSRSPIGEHVAPFSTIWSLEYLVGGTVLLWGNRGYPALRLAGLWLLIGAWAQNYVGTLAVLGFDLKSLVYPVFIAWAASALRTDQARCA